MKRELRQVVFSAIALTLVVKPLAAYADPIDPREVNLALQSYVTDMELTALNAVFGTDTNTVYRYGVDIGPNGWTGTLLGNHLGEDLTVAFFGTVTPTSPTTADIAFASNGLWGSRVWETDGVWHYVDPDLTGLQPGP